MTSMFFIGLGLIVGSFLNVLIVRRGKRSVTGRSECMSCRRRLAWYDLVPVFSWLILKGRCRSCQARISIQYITVEIGTAFLFLAIALAPLPLTLRLLALPIAALLIAIAIYDLYHTIIPDDWVYSFAGYSFFVSLFVLAEGASGNPDLYQYLLIGVSGPLVALPLFVLWFVSNGAWMGFGDVKFALGMGWLLGLGGGFIALFLGFILGALVSVPLLFFSSPLWERLKTFTPIFSSRIPALGFTMKSEIPFGPFLIAATLIVWLSNMYGFDWIDLVT